MKSFGQFKIGEHHKTICNATHNNMVKAHFRNERLEEKRNRLETKGDKDEEFNKRQKCEKMT